LKQGIWLVRVCFGCEFFSAKVVDKGVADRHVVDGRVADGCVADRCVFCKQNPRKEQRLALRSLIDLSRRSRAAAIRIPRGGLPAARKRWGKRVQKLTVNLGVMEIDKGKLGGGGSTRCRAGAVRFRRWRRWSGDWSAVRRRKKIGQGASV
jgi:hypothetical protein